MARTYSHRRRTSTGPAKAKPVEAMYAAGVAVFSLLMYIAIIVASVYMAGDTPKWLGGLGFIGFCIAIASFIYNANQMRSKTELRDRIICMSISSVVFIIWVATFILGMLS